VPAWPGCLAQSVQEALRLRKKTITAVLISVFAVAGLRD
jgi:hypothetical protein